MMPNAGLFREHVRRMAAGGWGLARIAGFSWKGWRPRTTTAIGYPSAPAPDSSTLACRRSHQRFEAWFEQHKGHTTFHEVVDRAPIPGWARALLQESSVDPHDEPSLNDLRDGGLVVTLGPDSDDPKGLNSDWWFACAADTKLSPQVWEPWGLDGHHRFSIPLDWFLRKDDSVPTSLLSVAGVAPTASWRTAWQASGFGPLRVDRDAPRHPFLGWRFGPIELAALLERWDLVERWGRQAPELVPQAQTSLIERGVRPWLQGQGWPHATKASPDLGGAAGAARIARAWEAIELRLAMRDVAPALIRGKVKPRL